MLRKIYYHQTPGQTPDFLELDVHGPAELIRAVWSQIPGSRRRMQQTPVALIAVRDGQLVSLNYQDFEFTLGTEEEIHIVPEVTGSDPVSAVAFISSNLAVNAFVATVIYISAVIAVSYVVSSIAMSLAPSIGGDDAQRPEERPSFIYNGPVNVVEQGYPVPIVYGTHMTGSVVISAGTRVERAPYEPPNLEPVSPDRELWQWV